MGSKKSQKIDWICFICQLKMRLLDDKVFVNGHKWGVKHPERFPAKTAQVIHASWVTGHVDKIFKMKAVGHWYFEPECSVYVKALDPRQTGLADEYLEKQRKVKERQKKEKAERRRKEKERREREKRKRKKM